MCIPSLSFVVYFLRTMNCWFFTIGVLVGICFLALSQLNFLNRLVVLIWFESIDSVRSVGSFTVSLSVGQCSLLIMFTVWIWIWNSHVVLLYSWFLCERWILALRRCIFAWRNVPVNCVWWITFFKLMMYLFILAERYFMLLRVLFWAKMLSVQRTNKLLHVAVCGQMSFVLVNDSLVVWRLFYCM